MRLTPVAASADDDVLAVDGCRHAVARVVGGVANALGVDLALVGDTHGLRDGVIGERLRKGCDLEQRLLGVASPGCTATTENVPLVRVPVLPKTTVSTSASVSR